MFPEYHDEQGLEPENPGFASLNLAHMSAAFGDLVREARDQLDDQEIETWIVLAATVISRLCADRLEDWWNHQ